VGPDQKLRIFSDAVRESPHNLVSRAARDALETRHIPESAALARWLPSDIRTLVDIGSGGGFPGIVIAIMRPEATIHLVESVTKKAQFLADMSAELGLNTVVHATRVERLARSAQCPIADAVTARAVASLQKLAEMATPFLRAGGSLYAIKGERWRDELDAAQETLERVKLRVSALPEANTEFVDGSLPRIVTLQKV